VHQFPFANRLACSLDHVEKFGKLFLSKFLIMRRLDNPRAQQSLG